jgi:hypothetical protein
VRCVSQNATVGWYTYTLSQAVLQLLSPLLGPSLSFNFRMVYPFMFSQLPLMNCVHDDSINLVVVTPLTENMPGPSATKPGDM